MSDERGWQRGGEHEPESSEERTEAYRAWQRQQQLQRPWDRQQPWQQESAPEPFVDQWGRPGRPQQGPDAGAPPRGMGRGDDDFRPAYRRDQQAPGPPPPNQSPFQAAQPPAPQPPRPGRPQPLPSPFQQQPPQPPQPPYPAPPRPDGPQLSARGRHGGSPDSQEPPPGSNPPRNADPSRRGSEGRGPDMYGNEPPRPGAGRRDDAGTETFRPNRPGASPSSRAEPGRAGRGAEGGRVNRDIDLDEVDPQGRGARYGGPGSGSGHGRSKPGDNGGNRGMLVVGATVGVVALALVAYFTTRSSGGNGTDAGTADATASQGPLTSPTPSGPVPSAAASGTATAGAGATGAPAATGAPTTSAGAVAVNIAKVHVAVFNGSGIDQRAATVKSALVNDGFALATVGGTATKTTETKVYYPSTRADSAAAVAKALAIPSANLSESSTYTEVTVVIGTDWATGGTYPAA